MWFIIEIEMEDLATNELAKQAHTHSHSLLQDEILKQDPHSL